MLDCFEINENTARSQRANLNYLICLKLHGFFFLVEATLHLPLWAELYLLMASQTSISTFAWLKLFLSVKWKQLLFQITFLRPLKDHSSRGNNPLQWLGAPIDICDNCGCLIYVIDPLLKIQKHTTTQQQNRPLRICSEDGEHWALSISKKARQLQKAIIIQGMGKSNHMSFEQL